MKTAKYTNELIEAARAVLKETDALPLGMKQMAVLQRLREAIIRADRP